MSILFIQLLLLLLVQEVYISGGGTVVIWNMIASTTFLFRDSQSFSHP